LRVEVSKNSRAVAYVKLGESETSTTTDAPSSALANPSPVIVLMPSLGEAGTASWPCSVSLATSFEPTRPVPPMTTIFKLTLLPVALGFEGRDQAARAQAGFGEGPHAVLGARA